MAHFSVEKLEEEFEKIDKNNDQLITVDELRSYYLPLRKMLGISDDLAEKEIQSLLQRLDKDNNGTIDFQEFERFMKGGC